MGEAGMLWCPVRFREVWFFSLANDFYLLRSFVVYSDVVAVPHLEKDVVMVRVF